jgi:ribonuclease G
MTAELPLLVPSEPEPTAPEAADVAPRVRKPASEPETLYIHNSPWETRVVLVQGQEPVELQVERTTGRGLSGNIYRGKVVRVIPSMDGAFVDIGLDKMALLHAGDVWEPGASAVGDDGEPAVRKATKTIGQLIKQGQHLMVQVVREPVAKKGPRVTTFVSLPGRNAVFLARDEHVGVSKMIADPAERQRLTQLVRQHLPQGSGAIVRTVGDGATEQELADDVRLLAEQWTDIQSRFDAATGPSFLFDDLDLTLRAIRDLVGPATQTVWIDDAGDRERVERFVRRFHPELQPAVRLHDAETPLLTLHSLDRAFAQATEPKVRLKSGGELVVQRTEAMTVIDVNSSRQVGPEGLAESLLQLNLEAARAIAIQLRLRNIGGLVIVDFVDMARHDHRRQLEAAFEAELARDRSRIRLGRLSEFGTVQLTRKRVRESVYDRLTEGCPACQGRGYVRSASDHAVETLERLRQQLQLAGLQPPAGTATTPPRTLRVLVPQRVVAILHDQLNAAVTDLASRFGVAVEVTAVSGRGPQSAAEFVWAAPTSPDQGDQQAS